MKKQDLKFGNVVETREGIKYLYHGQNGNKFLNLLTGESYTDLCAYDDNLLVEKYKDTDFDIVKVYKDYTCKELLWERKEKPVLTDDEKVILRNINKAFKYIARDRGDSLFVYTSKPIKKRNDWKFNYIDENLKDEWSAITIYNHLFQFIRWDDKEPYLIEDLLHE